MDLKEKLKKLEQKKRRIQRSEQLLKHEERKKRNHRIYTLGGICDKFGINLENFSEEVITGALKNLSESLKNDLHLKDEFEKVGKEIIQSEKSEKKPVIVTFDEKIENDTASKLRSFGLRWNRFREEWNGNIIFNHEIEDFIKSNNGKIEFIKLKKN